MTRALTNFYSALITIGTFVQPFILLAMRLFWGWQFFITGLDKFYYIAPVIEYFEMLHIPFPIINAYTVAALECGGGLCLLIGFASRLVCVPLMVVMIVALLTAHHDAVLGAFDDPQNLVRQTPFNFLLTVLIVFAFGPGAFSLDALLKRLKFFRIR